MTASVSTKIQRSVPRSAVARGERLVCVGASDMAQRQLPGALRASGLLALAQLLEQIIYQKSMLLAVPRYLYGGPTPATLI